MEMEVDMTSSVIRPYKETFHRIMPYILPNISRDELDRALEYSINKRFKDTNATIYNNYKEKRANISLYNMVEYIASRKPIITSYGVVFTRHGEVPNPLSMLIEEFATERNNFKKEMLKYDKGTELYNRYNLLQLVAKVCTNA